MHYFVHFTLVVTLVTVQGTLVEWSEVHSKGTGESQCIKSLDELINAFRRRETITGNHTNFMDDVTTIFEMELQYLLTYTMMFLTYQVSFSGNTTSYQCPVGASACCTPLDRESHLPLQSHTVMLYQSEIFGIFPAPLLALGSPLNVILVSSFKHTNLGLIEYCWSPPAFCKGVLSYQIAGMLRSFSIALAAGKLHPVEIRPPRREVTLPVRRSMHIPEAAAAGFITVNIAMLPAAMWLVTWCKRNLRRTGANSGLSSASMRQALFAAMMVNSWVWYAFLYISHIVILSMIKNSKIIRSPPNSRLVQDFLTPYVQHGYNMLVTLAVVHLMEFVVLMCYYSGISCQGQRQTRCKTAASMFGTVGVVLFVQMMSGFLLYFFMLLTVKPLLAIDQLSLMCSLSAIVLLLSVMGILPCISHHRDLPKQYAVLLPLVSIFLSITVLLILLFSVTRVQVGENVEMLEFISTILSSCLIGIMGYVAKRTLLPHLSRDGCGEAPGHAHSKEGDGEYKPLLPKV